MLRFERLDLINEGYQLFLVRRCACLCRDTQIVSATVGAPQVILLIFSSLRYISPLIPPFTDQDDLFMIRQNREQRDTQQRSSSSCFSSVINRCIFFTCSQTELLMSLMIVKWRVGRSSSRGLRTRSLSKDKFQCVICARPWHGDDTWVGLIYVPPKTHP